MKRSVAIVLFREGDLRVLDNPALFYACESADCILPVFIYAPHEAGTWAPGAASKWWLHHSLQSLQQSLEDLGSPLIIRRGDTVEVLAEIAATVEANSIWWNKACEPRASATDDQIMREFEKRGLRCEMYDGNTLINLNKVFTGKGLPYRVFGPFWNAVQNYEIADALPAPTQLKAPPDSVRSLNVDDLDLMPKIEWYKGIEKAWQPGEKNAMRRLKEFMDGALHDYLSGRDIPGIDGVSRLSPYLHFGEISPRVVWWNLKVLGTVVGGMREPANAYLRQIAWREFSRYLLFHFPETRNHPLRKEFASFPWLMDEEKIRAWRRAQTGYPIVDAGMRELWHTGWMHNRVRMIVASFLVKDLLAPWQVGARWFWDMLVDADLANNTMGWQWVAGCGADAAPYFRIFNPVLQGAKFDAEGEYVKRWLPELAKLDKRWIHHPWLAPPGALQAAGVVLGETYPERIIDHDFGRKRALLALQSMNK